MIDDLKPYPAMKDSGVPWCPQVPDHWELKPNRAYLRQRKVLVGERHPEYTLLSLTKRGVIVRDVTENKGKFSADMGTSQEVRKGDLVMCLFDVPETPRTVGLSNHCGMITGAYTVFEVSDQASASWLELFYIAMDDQKALSPLYSGLRNTIPKPRFLGANTPIPPPAEQSAIVRFLDHADRKIRRYIHAKQKLIKLLEEQKQAIIHRAVTRGLDPDVRLKPSGVEWLGDVPEHWEVVPVGAISMLLQTGPFGSQLHQSDYISGGIPVINPSHMVDGRIKNDPDVGISAEKAAMLSRHAIKADDILIARRGDLGRCALASSREEGWICGTGSILLRCRKTMLMPNFFQIVFSSRGMAQELQLSSIGATMANLNEGVVARQRIPLPTLEDQALIMGWIAGKARGVEISISSIRNEITLLHEYRTRLIADVVTGKLDVREAAAGLPEEEPVADESLSESYDQDDAEDSLEDESFPSEEE